MVHGCGATVAKFTLFVFNLLVWVASIVLIAVGGYVLNNSAKYSNLFGEDTNTLAVVCGTLIGIGCFIFLVGFLGCCGASTENSCFLKLYFTFLLILTLVEIVGGILALVFKDEIKETFDDELLKQVQQLYGLADQTVITDSIDALQRDSHCCGAENFTNYYGSEFSKLPGNQAVPVTCCIDETDSSCNDAKADGTIADPSKINTDGCVDKLIDFFESNFLYIGGAALGLVIVQILAMVMACCLISGIDNSGYETV
ncbi:CD63 antigen-like [Asterias rubens]|uniref:CD63 antigen-like n=1 Tax=Asterias rubens TaxID=7604 RepID=UPI001455AAC3|nr:CD63 antigen-like [Asterias rubens]